MIERCINELLFYSICGMNAVATGILHTNGIPLGNTQSNTDIV